MKNIAVLTGGFSGEAVIAEKSAAMVMRSIDRERYRPVLYRITEEAWTAHLDDESVEIDRATFHATFDEGRFVPDLAFVMIHGTPGEDGILQGYLELMGIPFTTGNVLNMSLTFSKHATTSYLRNRGYNVADSKLLEEEESPDIDEILAITGLPCFVKPNEGGSSIGMSKVSERNQLLPAIQKAKAVFPEVLIERFMVGREVTCGVLPINGKPTALPPTEIITDNEFFDYAAKYEGQSKEITPAEIGEEQTARVQDLAMRIYRSLNCKGMVRVDFILIEGQPHVIEVNTVPGFSEHSIIPQQAGAAGISSTQLITEVIESCL